MSIKQNWKLHKLNQSVKEVIENEQIVYTLKKIFSHHFKVEYKGKDN